MHALMPRRTIARLRSAPMRGHGARRHGRIREERGFALVIALMILMTLMLAMVAVGSGALDVNNQSTRQTAAVRASAAAAAGAQVALFRLNHGSTGATGESMGNGATYTYAISGLTGPTGPTNQCAGLWVQNAALQESCITSTGTVNGVSQRVQERVVGYVSNGYFPGLLALNGFSAAGPFIAANTTTGGPFYFGSNGGISFTNSHSINGDLEYPSGNPPSYASGGCTLPCIAVPESSAIPVPSVPASAWSAAEASNSDGTISWPSGFTYSGSPTWVVSQGGVNNASVTISTGTYFFCGIDLGGGSSSTITFNTNLGPVKMYFGSTAAGGACAGDSGGIGASDNNVVFVNSSGIASNVQLYFQGNPGCKTSSTCPAAFPVNGDSYTADVYAPNSWISVASPPNPPNVFTGWMVVAGLSANSALTFDYQAPSGATSSTTASYYPAGHANCLPPSTPGGTGGTC